MFKPNWHLMGKTEPQRRLERILLPLACFKAYRNKSAATMRTSNVLSRREESNLQPFAYKAIALPLSYSGSRQGYHILPSHSLQLKNPRRRPAGRVYLPCVSVPPVVACSSPISFSFSKMQGSPTAPIGPPVVFYPSLLFLLSSPHW